ncbi:sporulation related protein [Scopulibacillus darangshiensis]|uniref:Sporulation related protein n=1 Tax=Scopulibacillus darangshiensis TaxID=442528 RepID=A0A4R2PAW1_9BACL|nr:SPOR domain-containing protein [Scopulibacillus darangshiensis]TCP32233.1 sporulation related protein [Scopulibacillus darangshiensis]
MTEKHHSNNHMKVSFNGEERKLEEKKDQSKVAAVDKDKMLNWRDTFPKTADKQSIHDVEEDDMQHAAGHDPIYFPKGKKKKKKKKKRTVASKNNRESSPQLIIILKNIWIPLLSAVIVGLGLGFTILLLFSGDDKAQTTSKIQANSAVKSENTTSKPSEEAAKNLELDLNVIQAGAFSKQDQAKELANKLEDKGLASLTTKNDNFYVFAGLASDADQVDGLKEYFKNQGIDVYAKTWDIQSTKSWAKEAPLNQFFYQGKELLGKLLTLNNKVMVSGDHPKNSRLKDINKIKVGWDMIDDNKMSGLSKKERAKVRDFHSTLSDATMAANKLENKATKEKVSALEQNLMDAVKLYKDLVGGKE